MGPSLPWVRDRVPTPGLASIKACKLLYIDNYAVMGKSQEVVEELVSEMGAKFGQPGIQAVRDEKVGREGQLLGFVLDRNLKEWRPSPKRYWKIAFALDWVLGPSSKVTGREVEKLLGHLVSVMMLCRELLSIFQNVYDFARLSYVRRQPLWPSARKELQGARLLLPLVARRPLMV